MNLQLADNKKISKEDSFVSYLLYNRRVRPIHKREILREIIESVKIYNENLLNKNLLFIYKDNKKFSYIETKFLKSNFYHLTGLESKNINPKFFYEKCLNNKIKENEIKIRKDGTTMLKISVLRSLMNIHKNAKIIGDFNHTGIVLSTEKLVGNTTSCLGLKRIDKFYICNTLLKVDIRKVSINNRKIVSILSKNIQDSKYKKITYIDKNYHKEQELLKLMNELMGNESFE